MNKLIKNETGNRYGRLVVLEHVKHPNRREACWRCLCDCGNEHAVRGSSLRTGITKSCGCLSKEMAHKRFKKYGEEWRSRRKPERKNKATFNNGICKLELYDKKNNVIDHFIIDEENYDKIKPYRWGLAAEGYIGARLTKNDNSRTYLHRFILDTNCVQVDHANGDKLDNRKSNLREVTHSENFQNQMKRQTYAGKPTTSIYKGVSLARKTGKWTAQIGVYGKPIVLGRFKNEVDAAHAYNKAALKYFGEFARINII